VRGDDRHDRAEGPEADRYEPMPGITSLLRFLWRKAGRLGRATAAVGLLGVAAELERAVARDSRRRDGDSIEAVSCRPAAGEPARAPVRDLAASSARLSCLAVTTSFGPGEASEGGRIGNPYRAVIDFARGRVTYCRSYGRPGEASLERRILVTLPRACGG
jgi:hypothetical protein